MLVCIRAELLKMKRYSVIRAGVMMMTLSVLLVLFYSTAQDDTVWDFSLYISLIQQKNVQYFFPVVLALTGGYCITREEGEDTYKNLLTVPLSYRRILAAKAAALLVLTVVFSLFCALFAVGVNLLRGFPGMTPAAVPGAFGAILATNLLLYLAVFPIVFTLGCHSGTFLASLPLAFVYGYLATFEGRALNLCPTKAVLILTDPNCGAGFDVAYDPGRAALVLGILALADLLLLLSKGARLPEAQSRTAPTAGRKKGW